MNRFVFLLTGLILYSNVHGMEKKSSNPECIQQPAVGNPKPKKIVRFKCEETKDQETVREQIEEEFRKKIESESEERLHRLLDELRKSREQTNIQLDSLVKKYNAYS